MRGWRRDGCRYSRVLCTVAKGCLSLLGESGLPLVAVRDQHHHQKKGFSAFATSGHLRLRDCLIYAPRRHVRERLIQRPRRTESGAVGISEASNSGRYTQTCSQRAHMNLSQMLDGIARLDIPMEGRSCVNRSK